MPEVVLQVAPEVQAAGDAIRDLIAGIIQKKSVAEIAADVLPDAVKAVGSYADLGKSLLLADNEAYLVRSVKLGINGK